MSLWVWHAGAPPSPPLPPYARKCRSRVAPRANGPADTTGGKGRVTLEICRHGATFPQNQCPAWVSVWRIKRNAPGWDTPCCVVAHPGFIRNAAATLKPMLDIDVAAWRYFRGRRDAKLRGVAGWPGAGPQAPLPLPLFRLTILLLSGGYHMVDVDFSKFGGFIRRTERPFEVGSCLNTRGGRCIGNAVVKGG